MRSSEWIGIMLEFSWYENARQFEPFASSIEPLRIAAEDYISSREHFEAYCWVCRRMHRMLVRSGAMFGERPNLREGLLCEGCGLSNRKRLMYCAVLDEYRRLEGSPGEALLLEGLSPLQTVLSAAIPELIGSEFLGIEHLPGQEYEVANGKRVRHESLTELSFADGSLKLIVHLDILEHVPRYKSALRECFRTLMPGGSMVFTCPFFASRTEPLIRARFHDDGQIEHVEPPEIHGDPLSKEGILAWYHYGWGLLDDLREAGFEAVQLGCVYDVFSGFVSNDFPGGGYGLMLPIVIRASTGHAFAKR
jgi:SAM-dependent methyltransferase